MTPARTGTLLVCPLAARVRGTELMRDVRFDGLALAFLKNLERITLVSTSSPSSSSSSSAIAASPSSSSSAAVRDTVTTTTAHEYDIERSLVFEHGQEAHAAASGQLGPKGEELKVELTSMKGLLDSVRGALATPA